MTRFARAKGSKSSNERAPEDSTPWEVMKEQLLQSKKESDDTKKREEAEKQRIENYQNFLNEQKTQKKKATWCDFPEIDKIPENEPVKKKKKSVSKQIHEKTLNNNDDIFNNVPDDKKKKKQSKTESAKISYPLEIEEEPNLTTESSPPKKKKKQKKSKIIENEESRPVQQSENTFEKGSGFTETKTGKNSKKNKQKKFVDGKPTRRKEINDKSFQLIINGKEVQLVRYDGFPIMKKDAERLQELKNNMIKKGIPKGEVQRTMKLERRRAEKALARLKRDVCYNCRKGGHNLSDCPDLKSKIPGVDVAEGVCFKCGSTEHKQFECKVQKHMDFKFATCFICKEPGHIARQCPDNPKGLYPNGGCCKLCGDVTHLRKDCPTVQDKKGESSIKLQTLDSDNNIEGIVAGLHNTSSVTEVLLTSVTKPKKIKF